MYLVFILSIFSSFSWGQPGGGLPPRETACRIVSIDSTKYELVMTQTAGSKQEASLKKIAPDDGSGIGFCSATLIKEDTVLSAKHCFHSSRKTQYLVACNNQLVRAISGRPFGKTDFDPTDTKDPDLFEFRLEKPVNIGSQKPMSLPRDHSQLIRLVKDGDCYVFGFGKGLKGDYHVHKVSPVFAGGNSTLLEMISTIDLPPSQAQIQEGDSGGGLVCRDKSEAGKWYLIGANSLKFSPFEIYIKGRVTSVAAILPIRPTLSSSVKRQADPEVTEKSVAMGLGLGETPAQAAK